MKTTVRKSTFPAKCYILRKEQKRHKNNALKIILNLLMKFYFIYDTIKLKYVFSVIFLHKIHLFFRYVSRKKIT